MSLQNSGFDRPSSKEPLVFMRFRPAWAYIEGIREFGRFFCETTFGTTDVAERARVVIQETLENAVKYSTTGEDSELELMEIMPGIWSFQSSSFYPLTAAAVKWEV